MATKTFGKQPQTADDFTDALYEVAGVKFPLRLSVANGKIVTAEYDTTWKEGGTEPVEKKNNDGSTYIDYKENYTNKKLTAAQTKKIDTWIEENLEA